MFEEWIDNNLMPYMTLKQPNKKHSAYAIKHIVEKYVGRYISQEELQSILEKHGFPVSDYYPISEYFFRRYHQ